MKSHVALRVLGILLLVGSAGAQQTPFPLMVNTWGYAAGAISGWPAGIANWPNGEGSLTVTGSQGATTLTINSINVGVMSDYKLVSNTNGWAIVVLGDDGVYRVYTVYADQYFDWHVVHLSGALQFCYFWAPPQICTTPSAAFTLRQPGFTAWPTMSSRKPRELLIFKPMPRDMYPMD